MMSEKQIRERKMKKVFTDELKIGNWICDGSDIKKGKFKLGKVKGYVITEFTEFDMEKQKVKEMGEGTLTGLGIVSRLTIPEVKKLLLLKTKIKIVDNL